MSDIDGDVYRLIGILHGIADLGAAGFRLTPDLEEMQQFGAELQEVIPRLLEYVKSGREIPHSWRNASLGRWTGPWQVDDV